MAQNAPAEAAVPTGPRREVLIILPGLLLAIMLAMLDQLVVSTALPRIVGDLGGVTHLSWVVTAYVLASTVTTPLYGKLGDQYGRKRLLMFAIVLFLIGSALAGLSQTMDQLIAFRALQGLGAGGLLVGAIATIGDLVSPRERGQYMGYIMAAMTWPWSPARWSADTSPIPSPGAGSSTSTCRSAAPPSSTSR
jgi:MFS family permease